MGNAAVPELLERAQVHIIGRINLGSPGEHAIASRTGDEQLPQLFEEARQKLVAVEVSNAACCIDGRCAACSAARAARVENLDQIDATIERVPIKPHVPGGTYHFATLMAIAANLPLIAGAKTYAEAKQTVGSFLKENGIDDTIHTTVGTLRNPNVTGCGALDATEPGIQKANAESEAYDMNGEVSPINETMSVLYGYESPQALLGRDELFNEVRRNLVAAAKNNIMLGYRSTQQRDAMVEAQPESVEVLIGPHVEQGIAINEIDDTTVDRDSNDGRLFVYDRWFTRKLARIMDPTDRGQQRLLRAGDYVTLFITDQLVAPGQPVGIYTSAA